VRFDTNLTGQTGLGDGKNRVPYKAENIRFSEDALINAHR
jgi:hypothetical protein